VNSLYIQAPDLEEVNLRLQRRYDAAAEKEVLFVEEHLAEADIALVAYGTAARVAVTAIEQARAEGLKVGLLRPISVYPFPTKRIESLSEQVKAILVVELSLGQFVEDVRLSVEGRCPVALLGRSGGVVMTPREVADTLKKLAVEVGQ